MLINKAKNRLEELDGHISLARISLYGLYQSISNHNRAVAQLYRYSATWTAGSEELLANLMEELK